MLSFLIEARFELIQICIGDPSTARRSRGKTRFFRFLKSSGTFSACNDRRGRRVEKCDF